MNIFIRKTKDITSFKQDFIVPYFQTSTIPTYQKLNSFMESAKPSVYTGGNQEGMDRVMKEDGAYAYFMEEAALQYYMERNCELTQIGGLLDNKGYGIGLPLGKYTCNIIVYVEIPSFLLKVNILL